MAVITVLQPYVPQYRVPFFQALGEGLSQDGHTLRVVTGQVRGPQRLRSDTTSLGVVQRAHPTRTWALGPLQGRSYAPRSALSEADAVVVELAAGSIDSARALLHRRATPVGVWGHVKGFVEADTRLGSAIKRWQVRRADAVLAYTQAGADQAKQWGADDDSIFVLNNTVDLASLQRAVHNTPRETEASRTFSYIGALDAPKRIDLLADALDLLWQRAQDVHVLVAGEGERAGLLGEAVERGQVTLVGRADDIQKARMAARSIALLNPGRVGLIAPESFVLGLPILTTTGERHAPEFDYLHPGTDSIITDGTPEALATTMTDLLNRPAWARELGNNARSRAGEPSLDHMVRAFQAGVGHLLSANQR